MVILVNGTQLTEFVVTHLTVAARRVLADRNEFTLSAEAAEEWEKINSRPAQDLPGLRALMNRPSPFVAKSHERGLFPLRSARPTRPLPTR